MAVTYSLEPGLASEEFVDVLERSTLARRRPTDDAERARRMVRNADIVMCARDAGRLVGVARAITDFSYCCYLSDLAVDTAYQRAGIGSELMRRAHEAAGPETTLILLSAPGAMSYYARAGLDPIDNGWKIDRRK